MGRKRKCTSSSGKKGAVSPEDRQVKKQNLSKTISDGDFVEEEKVEHVLERVDSENVVVAAAEDSRNLVRGEEGDARFLGEPVPEAVAKERWPQRYQRNESVYNEIIQAKFHYAQAEVDGLTYCLDDDAFVESPAGKDSYICKIIEMFESVDGSQHITCQWYYRAVDTVIETCSDLIDNKRIFFSESTDVNPLDCLQQKLSIALLTPKSEYHVDVEKVKSTCDFYCDKKYLPPFSSFVSLASDSTTNSGEFDSTISSDGDALTMGSSALEDSSCEKTLLDLYAGCGAMSTGLCLGANSCGVKLVTKWAVDIDTNACESLQLNHPETQVRTELAEDFLALLKEWENLCAKLLFSDNNGSSTENGKLKDEEDDDEEENGEEDADADDSEVHEVDQILDMCHGDPYKTGTHKLLFRVSWKGYESDDDTWEPLENLSSCGEKLKEFVSSGYKSKILPSPGSVDVICGGPPCQGISGFNRHRNTTAPLEDEKNKQLLVFMDIVDYLRPKFLLMENVVDLLKFCDGYLGRYALARLLGMGYQARMGMLAAGAYGLPQFRMRVFIWGALPTEELPQYPLPTHHVVVRGVIPTDFVSNVVRYEKGQTPELKPALHLGDAISNLPRVENNEERDEMPYTLQPQTDFQRFISLRKDEMPGSLALNSDVLEHCLYDHRPLCLNQDDHERACKIPKKKGASFRDLKGVTVRHNKVEWDPNVERQTVSSGKFLVPDYAMSFCDGSSSKPFGRLWWDETVPTVVTRAQPHNRAILHPNQDRVLTIRENARLQGFPDYYKLVGKIKDRYIQVGNAVAVPVARALGYSLALALRGSLGDGPLLTLPADYPFVPQFD